MYHLVYNVIMNNKIQTKGRPKSFDEKEVLTIAMHYFWKNGYENTSLDNLLKTMNIKKSSFYSTFKSKEEIFSRCLALYKEQNIQFLSELKEKIGAKQAMLTLLEMTIKELNETGEVRGCLLVNSGKECYKRHDDLSHQINLEFNSIQTLFAQFAQEAKDKGEITSTKSAQVISGRYMNGLNGLIVTIQAGASQALIDDIVLSLKEILE